MKKKISAPITTRRTSKNNGAGAVVRSNKAGKPVYFIEAWGYDTNDPSFIFPSKSYWTETPGIPDYYIGTIMGCGAVTVGGENTDGNYAGAFDIEVGTSPDYCASENLGSRLPKLPRTT